MPHLGTFMTHLGPSCRHLAPAVRPLVANMSKKLPKNITLEPTSSKTAPKMPQTPLPSLPKVQKNKENLRFFNVFRFPTHFLKSLKNASRTAPDAPKLTSKCPSCRYHAPSYRHHGPSWRHHGPSRTRLDAILDPTSIILRHLRLNFARSSDQSAPKIPRTAPRAPETLSASDFL